jgi:hypothetical protein
MWRRVPGRHPVKFAIADELCYSWSAMFGLDETDRALIPIVSVLVVVAAIAGLVVAARHGHLLVASAATLTALAGMWLLAVLAVRADYQDADGFIDCWPSCTAVHNAVGATLFYGPVTALLVVIATALLARQHPR